MTVYDYDQIRPIDVFIITASAQVGIMILNLPKVVAGIMQTSDGWLAIIISGSIMAFFGWLIGKIIVQYPGYNIFAISTKLLGLWATRIIFFILALLTILYFANIIRITSTLAKLYFLDRTPIEVLGFTFTLVVVYCVAGLRIAIMRINLLFIPLIFITLIIIMLFNLGHMRWSNMEPYFNTDWKTFLQATIACLPRYNGIIVISFYAFLIKTSTKVPRMLLLGTIVVIIMSVLVFIFSVGVLGLYSTINSIFPTIEMAREAEVPGGFFERLQSFFFAVWMLKIFSSAVFALDISTMIMESLFRKAKKLTILLWLSPIGFFISMLPRNEFELFHFNDLVTASMFAIIAPLPVILMLAHKLRGNT